MTAMTETAKTDENPWLSNTAALACFGIAALMLVMSLKPNSVAATNAAPADDPIQLSFEQHQTPAPKSPAAKVH